MATLSVTHASAGALSGRLAQMKTQIGAALARRRIYRETMNELSALSDRELADLGFSRSMIRRLAIEAANKA